MTRSLTFKLILAFLIVGITGAALAAALAQWATARAFNQLVLDKGRSEFIAAAARYYTDYGSWEGVGEYLRRQAPVALQPLPRQNTPLAAQPPPLSFALADMAGRVIIPAGKHRLGEQLTTAELARGDPVEVEGAKVGTVLATDSPPPRDPLEEQYVARTNQALRYAALGAAAVALVLGALLARTLTSPLHELTTAIHAMAQGELEQEVPVRSQDELGELATAFNQMSSDLARANALRRQMTADIAHDLRTPLTVITGYLESLRDGVLKPSPARFDAMYGEAQHLQRLVEDLRTLSLADAGELPLNRRPTSPRALLEELAAAYEHRAAQTGVTLQIRANHYVPPIQVDPDRMKQVLSNLVNNALRYTPAGGQIFLSAVQRDDQILLGVQDSGAGITPEALPHVFERFYRGDPARPEQSGASGLGLAIAKSIVEMHGGRIWAESAPGAGSTFTIALPSAPPRERQTPQQA